MTLRTRMLALAAMLFSVATVGTARAADEEEEPPPPPKKPPHKEPKEPKPEKAEKEGKEPKEAKDPNTDHAKVVGHIGVSYFNQFNVPFGSTLVAATGSLPTVPTQLVGIRYWTSDTVGVDIGLGIVSQSASSKVDTTTTDLGSVLGFSLKAGVPIAMFSAAHYTFFIEPQLIFGYATQTIKASPPLVPEDIKNSGMHVALGAIAGAELQFGFLGIPHLALDATVGLGLDYQTGTTKRGAAPEASYSTTGFGTQAFASPWNIFTTNVAARYYF